uniref:Twin-arginine translocase TatA/TatE family subunit n=1 Tax=candidate division CPR3 bacterium TaxID=2268181 RepID=A0A7C4R4U8_UNCC3
MLQNIGLPEIIVILAVLFIFFGPQKLIEIARSLGKAGKEFKNINQEYNDVVEEIKKPPVKEEKEEEKKLKKNSKKKKGGDK